MSASHGTSSVGNATVGLSVSASLISLLANSLNITSALIVSSNISSVLTNHSDNASVFTNHSDISSVFTNHSDNASVLTNHADNASVFTNHSDTSSVFTNQSKIPVMPTNHSDMKNASSTYLNISTISISQLDSNRSIDGSSIFTNTFNDSSDVSKLFNTSSYIISTLGNSSIAGESFNSSSNIANTLSGAFNISSTFRDSFDIESTLNNSYPNNSMFNDPSGTDRSLSDSSILASTLKNPLNFNLTDTHSSTEMVKLSGNIPKTVNTSHRSSNIINTASNVLNTPSDVPNNASNLPDATSTLSDPHNRTVPFRRPRLADAGIKARLAFTVTIIVAIWTSSMPPAAAIWRNPQLHRTSYFYVMALCLLDCMLACSIGAMMITIAVKLGLPDALCVVFEALLNATLHAINALMLALSRERWRSLQDPIGYRATARRSAVWRHVALALLYGLTLGGGLFVASRHFLGAGLRPNTPLCDTFEWLLDPLNRPVIFVSVGGNILVDFGTIVYNARIMHCAWKVRFCGSAG